MEIIKVQSSSGPVVSSHPNEPDFEPIAVSAHVLSEEDTAQLVPRSVYAVSWGIGIRLAIAIWLLILLIPLFLTMMSVDAPEVPDGMVTMFFSLFIALCVYLLVLVVVAPSVVTRDSALAFSVRVSPFDIRLFSIRTGEVASVSRVAWRDLLFMRFVGFPTDWSRSVAVSLKSSRTIVVSLKQPDVFVRDLQACIP